MKLRIAMIGILALLLCSCGSSKKTAIEGTWSVVSGEKDPNMKRGPKKEQLSKAQLIFTDDKYSLAIDGTRQMEGTFILRPQSEPKEIDMIGGRAPNLGIYKINGDELTICFSSGEQGHRPIEFTIKPDTMRILLVLKRERP